MLASSAAEYSPGLRPSGWVAPEAAPAPGGSGLAIHEVGQVRTRTHGSDDVLFILEAVDDYGPALAPRAFGEHDRDARSALYARGDIVRQCSIQRAASPASIAIVTCDIGGT